MACPRCQGFVVVEWLPVNIDEALGSTLSDIQFSRCLNCGWVEDAVVRANRQVMITFLHPGINIVQQRIPATLQVCEKRRNIMDGYGFRVLVVEDDPSTRYGLAEVLAQEGYNVVAAEDGLAAIEELKKRHYDVILANYQIPLLNGLTLLALSRKLVPETPVILMSSAHPILERVAAERGAFNWIRKPTSARQVLATVHAAVEHTCGSSASKNTRDPRIPV